MKTQDKQLLLNAALILGGYIVIVRPILESLSIIPTAEEKKQQATSIKNIEQWANDRIKNQMPTKTAGEWAIIADQIYNALRYSALNDDKDLAAYQFARVKNEADVATLYKAFGKRQEYFFGIPAGSKMDLVQFLNSNLSTTKINALNDNLRRKNIKFQL